MKRIRYILVVSILFVVGVSVAGSSTGSNPGPETSSGLPSGDWTLVCGPTSKPGTVVDVYRVTTEAEQGLAITKVGVRNRTTHNVAAIRLSWRLIPVGQDSVTLLQGASPLLRVTLSPRKRQVVEFPLVVFKEICKPLLNEGSLQGRFRIEVAASEVVFEDNSSWTLGDDRKAPALVPVSSRRVRTPFLEVIAYQDEMEIVGEEAGAACQHKSCSWSYVENRYTCPATDGFNCKRSSNAQSCTESRC